MDFLLSPKIQAVAFSISPELILCVARAEIAMRPRTVATVPLRISQPIQCPDAVSTQFGTYASVFIFRTCFIKPLISRVLGNISKDGANKYLWYCFFKSCSKKNFLRHASSRDPNPLCSFRTEKHTSHPLSSATRPNSRTP
jgi:hypothetical protein